jgi:predicted PhzF superfamily epimerase YddE/YHI9
MPAQARLCQVVTFATDLQHGNPAVVLSGVGDASDRALATICDFLHADVLAVVGDLHDGVTPLRFFTATGPHAGPGHSTLAAAHIALRDGEGSAANRGKGAITFRLPDGDRRVAHLDGGRIYVEFPAMPARRVDQIAEMEAALGVRPLETWVAPFGYVAVFNDQKLIARMDPDLERIAAFDRSAVIATAPGDRDSDVVLRVFAPNVGLPEDQVCGTAHRIIVPYWASKLGKKQIHSRQLSQRGGDLWCEDAGESVVIGGESGLMVAGTIRLPDL